MKVEHFVHNTLYARTRQRASLQSFLRHNLRGLVEYLDDGRARRLLMEVEKVIIAFDLGMDWD